MLLFAMCLLSTLARRIPSKFSPVQRRADHLLNAHANVFKMGEKSPQSKQRVPAGGDIIDPSDLLIYAACMGDISYDDDDLSAMKVYFKKRGECCAQNKKVCGEDVSSSCATLRYANDIEEEEEEEEEEGMPAELVKAYEEVYDAQCDAYCKKSDKKPKWCGLSAGAIAGIVIACVVVVAAYVGLLVYFLVIRPKSGKVAGQE
jgi:hypothetical protein